MLEAIGSWPGAVWLQQSGTAYLIVNATHILGIGVLLGGILPLDLRLLGLFRRYPLDVLEPFLVRSSATGLAIALVTGLWLFSVKPEEYLANRAFLWKAALLAVALVNVVVQHWGKPNRISAGLSIAAWLAVLLAGRWIGFL